MAEHDNTHPHNSGQAHHQAQFAGALLSADRPVPGDAVHPRANDDDAAARHRFGVYRNNVTVSLIEACMAAYPAVNALVGEDFFRAMASHYVRQHPPRSPLMMRYGDQFPDFIESFAPAASLPYLPGVARLERAWLRAYHAADAEPATGETFGAIDPEALMGAHCELHPSFHLLTEDYDVASLWAVNTGRSEEALENIQRPTRIALIRPHLDVYVHEVSPSKYAMLQSLQADATLGEALESALGADEHADVSALIGFLISTGVVTHVRTTHSEPPTPNPQTGA